MRMEGKVAIVTGGANGIGKAIALGYAREGATVIIADIDSTNGAAVADMINTEGGKALFVRTDVAEWGQTEQLVKTAIDYCGKVDVLFTSAAIMERISILDSSIEDFDRTMNVNLIGVMNCIQCLIPHMKERGEGRIIVTISPSALYGRALNVAYAAAEGTLDGVVRNAAARLGQFGIRVNGIMPGLVDTDFPESLKDEPEYRDYKIKNTPLGRIENPEDLVGTALFLTGNDSSFITGEIIAVDGGLQNFRPGAGVQ